MIHTGFPCVPSPALTQIAPAHVEQRPLSLEINNCCGAIDCKADKSSQHPTSPCCSASSMPCSSISSTLNPRTVDGGAPSASGCKNGESKACTSAGSQASDCCKSDDCKLDSEVSATVLKAHRLLQTCCAVCWSATAYSCCHSACCATACCLLKLHAKMRSILDKRSLSGTVDAAKDGLAKQHKTSLPSPTDRSLLRSPQSSSSSHLLDEPVVITLPVSGFTCTDCATSVEQKLRKLVGVTQVRASALTGQTEVTYDFSLLKSTVDAGAAQQGHKDAASSSQDIDIDAFLIAQVEQLGFSAVVQQATVANTLRFLVDTTELQASLGAQRDGKAGVFLVDKLLTRAVLRLQCESGVISDSVTCTPDWRTHLHSIDVEYNPDVTGARVLLNLIATMGCSVALDSSLAQKPREDPIVIQRRNWRRRWWFCAIFCLPVVIIAFVFPAAGGIVGDPFSHELASGLSVSTLVLFLLATPIQFGVGWPLYDSAYRALRYGHNANADTLVMLSTSIAYFYSIIATVCALAGSEFTGLPAGLTLYPCPFRCVLSVIHAHLLRVLCVLL